MSESSFIRTTSTSWSNSTFIFPCISIGNIGQLSADLLISTIPNMVKAGYFIDNNLVQPIIGYDPYNQTSRELCVSVELYECKELNLVVMQQRAPLLKGKRSEFVRMLIDFVKKENFRETICLTSSYAYERLDSQLTGNQCRFLSTGVKKDDLDQLVNELKWLHLEKRIDHNNTTKAAVNGNGHAIVSGNGGEQNLDSYIPGGGIAQRFYKLSTEANLNLKVLIIFAHEGNNIPEALALVNYLNQWKHYLEKTGFEKWKIPISWNYLFGQNLETSTKRIF